VHATRFDRLTQVLFTAGSRRGALRALLAVAGSALSLAGGQRVSAQNCAAAGKRCGGGREPCCSGWCKRKRGSSKKFCRQADNQGVCTVVDNICAGSSHVCGRNASGAPVCLCFVTTSGRSFCGAEEQIQPGNCDCVSNQECEQRIGKGAKCIQVDQFCDDACPGSTTGCKAPCPNLNPVP
jgi:hypothetical protein